MIDFESNIPYYVQLINLLKSEIVAGTWKPGDQIPGEPELCNHYNISRTVVRQALAELELQGLIDRRKGKGTFVAHPKVAESLVQKLTGFYQDMSERGYKPVTRVLIHRIIPANEKIAGYLEVAPGTMVFEIKRLRFISEAPIQLVTSFIPYNLCPKLESVDLTNRSLYVFLEQDCGLVLARGRRFIEAVPANDSEAKLLHVEKGAPLVMLDSVSYLDDGRPVEYYHALHRGDRSRFEVELVRVHDHVAAGEKMNNLAEELPNSNSLIFEKFK